MPNTSPKEAELSLVASKLYALAISDEQSMAATAARIFLLKTRAGWTESAGTVRVVLPSVG